MKKKGKNINIARIVWVSCIFLLLITILIMVMDYKINYQYKVENKLYFYECDDNICTTQTKTNSKKLLSVYDCYFDECPIYRSIVNDDYVLLEESDGYILYNYKTGDKIVEGYDNYIFVNNDYIIVTKGNLDGVIDLEGNIIINPEYDKIGYYKDEYLLGYNTNSIIAKKDDTYGIINYKDGSLVEEFKYKESDIQTLLDLIEKG